MISNYPPGMDFDAFYRHTGDVWTCEHCERVVRFEQSCERPECLEETDPYDTNHCVSCCPHRPEQDHSA